MSLIEILRIANRGYERGQGPNPILSLRNFFDKQDGTPFRDEMGDGLAKFIVQELYETNDSKQSSLAQLETAHYQISKAAEQLITVEETLDRALREAKRNPLDRLAEIPLRAAKRPRLKGGRK